MGSASDLIEKLKSNNANNRTRKQIAKGVQKRYDPNVKKDVIDEEKLLEEKLLEEIDGNAGDVMKQPEQNYDAKQMKDHNDDLPPNKYFKDRRSLLEELELAPSLTEITDILSAAADMKYKDIFAEGRDNRVDNRRKHGILIAAWKLVHTAGQLLEEY